VKAQVEEERVLEYFASEDTQIGQGNICRSLKPSPAFVSCDITSVAKDNSSVAVSSSARTHTTQIWYKEK